MSSNSNPNEMQRVVAPCTEERSQGRKTINIMPTNEQSSTRGIKRRRIIISGGTSTQAQITEQVTRDPTAISYEHGMENPLIQNLDRAILLRLLACRECKSWKDDIHEFAKDKVNLQDVVRLTEEMERDWDVFQGKRGVLPSLLGRDDFDFNFPSFSDEDCSITKSSTIQRQGRCDVISGKSCNSLAAYEYMVTASLLGKEIKLGVYSSIDEAVERHDMHAIGRRSLGRLLRRCFQLERLTNVRDASRIALKNANNGGVSIEEMMKQAEVAAKQAWELFNDKQYDYFNDDDDSLNPVLVFPLGWKYLCPHAKRLRQNEKKIVDLVNAIFEYRKSRIILADIIESHVLIEDYEEDQQYAYSIDQNSDIPLQNPTTVKTRALTTNPSDETIDYRIISMKRMIAKRTRTILIQARDMNRIMQLEHAHMGLFSDQKVSEMRSLALYRSLIVEKTLPSPWRREVVTP